MCRLAHPDTDICVSGLGVNRVESTTPFRGCLPSQAPIWLAGHTTTILAFLPARGFSRRNDADVIVANTGFARRPLTSNPLARGLMQPPSRRFETIGC